MRVPTLSSINVQRFRIYDGTIENLLIITIPSDRVLDKSKLVEHERIEETCFEEF